MSLEIIPKNSWNSFLESFALLHQSNLFNLEKLKMRNKNTLIAKDLRLRSISVNKDGYESTTIIAVDKPGNELPHLINQVKNIAVEKDANGKDKALYINSSRDNVFVLIIE